MIDLKELREVVEKATPGKWISTKFPELLCSEKVPIVNWMGFNDSDRSDRQHRYNARHIATFDPPMVKALLGRLEAAEAALDAILSWNVNNRRGLPRYQRDLLEKWCQIIEAQEKP